MLKVQVPCGHLVVSEGTAMSRLIGMDLSEIRVVGAIVFTGLLVCLSGCHAGGKTKAIAPSPSAAAPSPSNSFAMTQAEVIKTTAAAENGDAHAMQQLAAFYLIHLRKEEPGWYWMEKAAEAGIPEARRSMLNYYSSRDSAQMKARGEELKKKWGM
jgi:hypothetical protein